MRGENLKKLRKIITLKSKTRQISIKFVAGPHVPKNHLIKRFPSLGQIFEPSNEISKPFPDILASPINFHFFFPSLNYPKRNVRVTRITLYGRFRPSSPPAPLGPSSPRSARPASNEDRARFSSGFRCLSGGSRLQQ